MITLLHGENTVASRKELDRIKSEFKGEIVVLDGKTVTETEFIQATQAQSLFGEKKLVVVEGMMKFDLSQVEADLVVWESKTISNLRDLSSLRNLKIQEFKIPQTIWKFLDNPTVPNFRQALKDNDVQFIFLMLVRKYRLSQNGLALKKLLEIDYQFKTGRLPGNLPLAIELFLLGL